MAAPTFKPGPDIQAMRQKFYQSKQDDVSRQFKGAQQEQEDQIARRMTAIGQAGSGAAMGLQMKGRESLEGQKQKAMSDLTGQQAQEDIASNEAQIGRDFSTFMADKDQALKQKFFDAEQGNKLRELDLADKQFAMDQDVTAFNKEMARLGFHEKTPGLLGDWNLQKAGTGLLSTLAPVVTAPINAIKKIGGGK